MQAVRSKTFTALVVDDDHDVVQTLTDILESEGARVLTAEDALAGMGAALAGRPDVILLDVRMPRIDGLELAGALRANGLDAPVVLITAMSAAALPPPQEMRAMGIATVLFKPFTTATLLGCVHDVIK